MILCVCVSRARPRNATVTSEIKYVQIKIKFHKTVAELTLLLVVTKWQEGSIQAVAMGLLQAV